MAAGFCALEQVVLDFYYTLRPFPKWLGLLAYERLLLLRPECADLRDG